MEIAYTKYNATGNSFVILDGRSGALGALGGGGESLALLARETQTDGVICLERSTKADVRMVYFNADGGQVDMCGNGARSVAHYLWKRSGSREVGIETNRDVYRTRVEEGGARVSIKMGDISGVDSIDLSSLLGQAKRHLYVEVGVPHCVFLVDRFDEGLFKDRAPAICRHSLFPKGANVNFVEAICLDQRRFLLRTFERGVGETLSCATGATAAAVAVSRWFGLEGTLSLAPLGGRMEVFIGDCTILSAQVCEVGGGMIWLSEKGLTIKGVGVHDGV